MIDDQTHDEDEAGGGGEPHEPVDLHGDGEHSPEVAVAQSLQRALEQMKEESRRIADLGTGDEQVEGAERFADAAAALDEQLGSLARAEEEQRGR